MKNKLICVFIALFTAVCIFAGCNGGGGPVREPNGGGDADPEQSSGDFTVTLTLNGAPFSPSDNVTATWDDGESRSVTAKFGSDGVARASGLDGDYTVRVSGLPSEYAFDPNGTVATNYNRKIELKIYRAIVLPAFQPPQFGDVLYGAVELRSEGAYRITLRDKSEIYYCLFEPRIHGMYSVKSLIDITQNEINPKYQVCSGTRYGARYKGAIVDGGGASSTYTVNFDHRTGFNFDEVNGGILIFGVLAETRNLEFPLTFDILLERTGDYERQDINAPIVIPEEFAAVTSGKIDVQEFRAQKDAFMRGQGNNRVFTMFYPTGHLNGDLVAFNEKTGYYHLYDKVTDTYGAVICAKISQSCGILEEPFNTIEYIGNKALTIDDNYDKFYKKTPPKYKDKDYHYINYKVFIEGYRGIASHEAAFPGISQQFAPYAGEYGYAELCNSDGVYPVNKELQRFLQGYATNARLFMDGNGWAETDNELKLMSAEEDQWMFACGYYE